MAYLVRDRAGIYDVYCDPIRMAAVFLEGFGGEVCRRSSSHVQMRGQKARQGDYDRGSEESNLAVTVLRLVILTMNWSNRRGSQEDHPPASWSRALHQGRAYNR